MYNILFVHWLVNYKSIMNYETRNNTKEFSLTSSNRVMIIKCYLQSKELQISIDAKTTRSNYMFSMSGFYVNRSHPAVARVRPVDRDGRFGSKVGQIGPKWANLSHFGAKPTISVC